MEESVGILLHPAHVDHGSVAEPQALFPDTLCLTAESIGKRLSALQHFADDEAMYNIHKLAGRTAFLPVDVSSKGLTIRTDLAGSGQAEADRSITLTSFFGQMAQRTLDAPMDFPALDMSIIGVIAVGCPPEQRDGAAAVATRSAVWLLLVVAHGDERTTTMSASTNRSIGCVHEVADRLASIGYIRNDFDECYDLGCTLGQGSFATVRAVGHKPTLMVPGEEPAAAGEQVGIAAKVLVSTASVQAVAFEASYLVAVQSHPNIVKFLGIFYKPQGWALLMERCNGGDLRGYVDENGQIAEELCLDLVGSCIFSALDHIHACSMLHRDVKPDNILVDHHPGAVVPYRTVLVDFGIACHRSERGKMATRCGSPGSVAPEVLLKSRYSPKADVFSAGVALYFALSARMPFAGEGHYMETLKINAKAILKFEEISEAFEDVSAGTKKVLSDVLNRNPCERPSAMQAFTHVRFQIQKLQEDDGTSITSEPNVAEEGMSALETAFAQARMKVQHKQTCADPHRSPYDEQGEQMRWTASMPTAVAEPSQIISPSLPAEPRPQASRPHLQRVQQTTTDSKECRDTDDIVIAPQPSASGQPFRAPSKEEPNEVAQKTEVRAEGELASEAELSSEHPIMEHNEKKLAPQVPKGKPLSVLRPIRGRARQSV